jgi:biotin carboxyl carrier protein
MKTYHMRIDDRLYTVNVSRPDTNPIRVEINDEVIEVWLDNGNHVGTETQPTQPGLITSVFHSNNPENNSATKKTAAIELLESGLIAPLPGVVTEICVQVGDQIVEGQEICHLEAMKMKNIIRSDRSGTVGNILISIGEHVRHQQVLVEFIDQAAER